MRSQETQFAKQIVRDLRRAGKQKLGDINIKHVKRFRVASGLPSSLP
jgi:hypothetical protein